MRNYQCHSLTDSLKVDKHSLKLFKGIQKIHSFSIKTVLGYNDDDFHLLTISENFPDVIPILYVLLWSFVITKAWTIPVSIFSLLIDP